MACEHLIHGTVWQPEQEAIMRKEITDVSYRVFTYQDVDRVPDIEFGYWPQTLRRWLKEGMDVDLTEDEKNSMFVAKVDEYFGFEHGHGTGLGVCHRLNPMFEHEVLEKKAESEIVRTGDGNVLEQYAADSENSSIPRFISAPIETPDDWAGLKERYRIDDPIRQRSEEEIDNVRKGIRENRVVGVALMGIYAQIRNWMGVENASLAFYDYPEMVHDMADHFAELMAVQIDDLPDDIVIDKVSWWEDMAGKSGPLVGPNIFREFLQPGYHRVMEACKKRGCVLGVVDCDGNPHDIVANWMEEGVNIMFPLEVTAGVDPYAWREEFGMDLRLQGGIAKRPLVLGGKAIDEELERIKPLIDQGGYIPHLDHLVPPDISFKNYCEYLEKKRKLIGK